MIITSDLMGLMSISCFFSTRLNISNLSKVCLSFQTEQMFKNTYFVEHLRMASSVSLLSRYLRGFDLLSFDLLFLLNTYLATSSTHLSIKRSSFCSCFVIIC